MNIFFFAHHIIKRKIPIRKVAPSLNRRKNIRDRIMVYFKNLTVVAFVASVALSLLPGAQSATYILSDDRVRSLDFTPALGRGYSLSTNTFQSTCLDIDVTSVPSYNYDCECCSPLFSDYICIDDCSSYSIQKCAVSSEQ